MFDKKSLIKKLLFWSIFTANLIFAYLLGYWGTIFGSSLAFLYFLVIIPIILSVFSVRLYESNRRIILKKEVLISVYFILNLLFAYLIGLYLPFMESIRRDFFPIFMLPMLAILNFVLIKRLQYYLDEEVKKPESEKEPLEEIKYDKPVIEYEDKKYIFSIESLLLLAIGAPLSAYLIYIFFDLEINYWLHEIVVKQTVYFLNLLFDMGVQATYSPIGKYHWSFTNIGSRSSIGFETFCTGVQAICVFAGVIIFAPHSQDKDTSRDIIWRKTKSLIISSVIFYAVNIIRMLIQIYLYYIGYAWDDIHYSISAASSFIAAIIVLLMHKWIPEFIISLIYAYSLIKQKITGRSKKK
ncbi:MAG: hypothetical protein GF311_01185 [Candidatus Lokiarchaeota archaeon]|nr:hypothetical protein [Candidatus Lokiarchaeota archaeon]